MDRKNVIVTIGRQTGSGGREVGQRLAEKLGIRCYDREILTLAAKDSGFDEKIIEHHDERPTNSLLYSLYMGVAPFSFGGNIAGGELPLDNRIFLAQFDAIKKIADEGPCVIVGRCADYALEGHEHLLTVFVLGDEEDRIARLMDQRDITEKEARELMTKGDKNRSNYYNYYANKKWGSSASYDLCVNSSAFGIDGCADLILHAIDSHID